MPSPDDVNKLHQQTEQNRLNLLRTDLNLIRTLTDLVETELNIKNREHAVQSFARASKGYGDMCRIFDLRQSWEEGPTNEIIGKLAELRKDLDRLQRLLYPEQSQPIKHKTV